MGAVEPISPRDKTRSNSRHVSEGGWVEECAGHNLTETNKQRASVGGGMYKEELKKVKIGFLWIFERFCVFFSFQWSLVDLSLQFTVR